MSDPAPLMPYERKSFSVGMPLNDKFRENYDAIDWSDDDDDEETDA